MHKIGYFNSKKHRQSAQLLADKLGMSSNLETALIPLHPVKSINHIELALKSLTNDICDIFCMDLTDINHSLPPDILIAGLSDRSARFDKLIYTADPESLSPHIKLREDARVVCYSERSKALANHLFPGWILTLKENKPGSIKAELANYDGLILNNNYLDEYENDIGDFASFQFHPKEFISQAGQNVTAYLCKTEEKDIRKTISKIHISEVSQATNIERTIEHYLVNKGWDSIGVYCLLDSNSHYHVHVCGRENNGEDLKKCRYSSGTSENIVYNVFELLSKND